MSDEAYIKAYEGFNREQAEVMWELYMSGTNQGGHVWVTYGDVEKAVAKIIMLEKECK